MSIVLALIAAQATISTSSPQIEITTKIRRFSCEARDSDGRLAKFDAEVTEWQKFEKNDSGSVFVRADSAGIPAGSYIAVARDRDVSLSNYLSNAAKPTRMKLIIGENGEAALSVEAKASGQGKLKPRLYAGFCKGDFSGIGAA